MSDVVSDVRKAINDILDRVDHGLPMPYSIDPDKDLGTIDVSWMLTDNLTASRAVIRSYQAGGWITHPGSSGRELILEQATDFGQLTIWAHPDSVRIKIEVPE